MNADNLVFISVLVDIFFFPLLKRRSHILGAMSLGDLNTANKIQSQLYDKDKTHSV